MAVGDGDGGQMVVLCFIKNKRRRDNPAANML
jgi:hypothetical protein